MKFIVTRTSQYSDSGEPPCEGAYLERHDTWDKRAFKTLEEHDNRLRVKWLDRGVDHKVTETGIERRFPMGASSWFIDLPDMAALMDFCRVHGEVVLSDDWLYHTEYPRIEIYDAYRE